MSTRSVLALGPTGAAWWQGERRGGTCTAGSIWRNDRRTSKCRW